MSVSRVSYTLTIDDSLSEICALNMPTANRNHPQSPKECVENVRFIDTSLIKSRDVMIVL